MPESLSLVDKRQMNIYNSKVQDGVDNEYPTENPLGLREPSNHLIVAVRNSGKSYLASQMLAQAKKDNMFDRIYLISPSYESNQSYFSKFIKKESVYQPTKSSVNEVISQIEADRDEWEEYLEKLKRYQGASSDTTGRPTGGVLARLMSRPNVNRRLEEKPKWKYEKNGIQPPRSLLILDDVLSSPALSAGGQNPLAKIATLNRHIAPLKEVFKGPNGTRSSCGCGIWCLTQTYSMPQGIGRVMRENLTHLTLFKNKQKKMREKIMEELGSVVSEDLIQTAWDHCCNDDKPYGKLTIDFKPRCNTLRLRENLNTALVYDAPECQCTNQKCKICR